MAKPQPVIPDELPSVQHITLETFGFSGSRTWIYPLSIKGRFQKYHRLSALALHAFLFITPWITINGNPALRIDLPHRRVFLAGSIFTAADGFLLVLLGLFAAFSLFFFTSLFGRLWCGFTCPQTVFMEEWIRPLEKLWEGDRSVRMRRDKGPWSFDKAWRRAGKLTSFFLVALVLSMSFMGFWAGAPELWTGQAGSTSYAIVGIFTMGWFADFAWFREQLCAYLCPYARFQSALADDESLVVSYVSSRGEPREKGKAAAKDGRCIECNKCVAVCPAGIDIRDGFQLECISCARCVDACESVMHRLGHETLVKYTTIAEEEGRENRLIRGRTVLYAGLLTAIGAGIISLTLFHNPIEAEVNRAPGSLFQLDDDGYVRNTFLLQVTNNLGGDEEVTYEVTVDGPEGLEWTVAPLSMETTETRKVPLVVRVPHSSIDERTLPLTVTITGGDAERVLSTTFKTDKGIGG